MTQEEIKLSSQKKVDAINTLCRQLQVTISAEQMINQQGLIKNVVYYNDTEQYPVDQPITTKQDELPLPPQQSNP